MKGKSKCPRKVCPLHVSGNEFKLNVIILTILAANIVKVVMRSHDIASCTNTFFSFGNLNNQNSLIFTVDNNTISVETKKLNSSLVLKPPPDIAVLFNQFKNVISENCSDPENVI